jgi:hypothetical protein
VSDALGRPGDSAELGATAGDNAAPGEGADVGAGTVVGAGAVVGVGGVSEVGAIVVAADVAGLGGLVLEVVRVLSALMVVVVPI